MRKLHYLLALPLGLTILACESQPEQQLMASFVDAVQKSDETALGRTVHLWRSASQLHQFAEAALCHVATSSKLAQARRETDMARSWEGLGTL